MGICQNIISGGIQLFIYKKDINNAKLIIEEYLKNKKPTTNNKYLESELLETDEKKCYRCNSTKIKKFIKQRGLASVIILFFFGFFMPIKISKYYCEECGYEWKKKIYKKAFNITITLCLIIIFLKICWPIIKNIISFYEEYNYIINQIIIGIVFLIILILLGTLIKKLKK